MILDRSKNLRAFFLMHDGKWDSGDDGVESSSVLFQNFSHISADKFTLGEAASANIGEIRIAFDQSQVFRLDDFFQYALRNGAFARSEFKDAHSRGEFVAHEAR